MLVSTATLAVRFRMESPSSSPYVARRIEPRGIVYGCRHSVTHITYVNSNGVGARQAKWAESMKLFLIELNKAVEKAMGKLVPKQAKQWQERYRVILN